MRFQILKGFLIAVYVTVRVADSDIMFHHGFQTTWGKIDKSTERGTDVLGSCNMTLVESKLMTETPRLANL